MKTLMLILSFSILGCGNQIPPKSQTQAPDSLFSLTEEERSDRHFIMYRVLQRGIELGELMQTHFPHLYHYQNSGGGKYFGEWSMHNQPPDSTNGFKGLTNKSISQFILDSKPRAWEMSGVNSGRTFKTEEYDHYIGWHNEWHEEFMNLTFHFENDSNIIDLSTGYYALEPSKNNNNMTYLQLSHPIRPREDIDKPVKGKWQFIPITVADAETLLTEWGIDPFHPGIKVGMK